MEVQGTLREVCSNAREGIFCFWTIECDEIIVALYFSF